MIIVKRVGINPDYIPEVKYIHVHSDDNFFYFAENEEDMKLIEGMTAES